MYYQITININNYKKNGIITVLFPHFLPLIKIKINLINNK